VTAGTIFQDTRTPLRVWFRAMWYVTSQKNGVSALGLQRVLGLGSYETAWVWLHKLRRAMVRPGRDRLSGVVEADEIYVGGKRRGLRGRATEGKSLVLVAAQAEGAAIGRIRLGRIPDFTGATLGRTLQTFVEPGSVIQTDGLRAYRALTEWGYIHEVVRTDAQEGDDPLPRVHRVASLLKRWLLGTHQGAIRHSHLDYYLDEFTFRFNRRTSRSRGKLFYRLLQQAVAVDPVPLHQLHGGTALPMPPAEPQPESSG
jgi:transposase-like protein